MAIQGDSLHSVQSNALSSSAGMAKPSKLTLPPLMLPASPPSIQTAPHHSPSVIASKASRGSPLSAAQPAVYLGLSPTQQTEKLTHEVATTPTTRGNIASIAGKMRAIEQQLTLITPASKKTLEQLKLVVTELGKKVKTNLADEGLEITRLATHVLADIQNKLQHHSPKAAAAKAPAFHAATRLKKQLVDTAKVRQSAQGVELQARYQALAQKIEEHTQKSLLNRQQFDELFPEVAEAEQNVEQFNSLSPDEQLAQAAEGERLKAAHDELLAKTDPLDAEFIELENDLKKFREELAQIGKQIQLQQTDTGSINPVFIERPGKFVFKMQSAVVENRVQTVCALLDASYAITPSHAIKAAGTVQYQEPRKTVNRAEGVVQPLIERGKPCVEFVRDGSFNEAVTPLLDKVDSQKKMALQGVIGAWDLHSSNAFVQVAPNAAFEELEKTTFEYFDPTVAPGSWKEVSLTELAYLKLAHNVTQQTLVRTKGDAASSTIENSPKLTLALGSPLRLVMFDNERAIGGGKQPHTGNPNHFTMYGADACLPVRCFFLGCDIAEQPLQKEAQEQLLGLPSKKELLRKTVGIGNPLLFQKLSNELQGELTRFFESGKLFFTWSVANGYGSRDLLSQMPAELTKKVAAELTKIIEANDKKAIDQLKVKTGEELPRLEKKARDLSNQREMILARMNRGNVRVMSAEHQQLEQAKNRADTAIKAHAKLLEAAKLKMQLLTRYEQSGPLKDLSLKYELLELARGAEYKALEKAPTPAQINDLKQDLLHLKSEFPELAASKLFTIVSEQLDHELNPDQGEPCNLTATAESCIETMKQLLPAEKHAAVDRLAASFLQKANRLDAQAAASPLALQKEALRTLMVQQLFPSVDPKELTALCERMDASKSYIEAYREKAEAFAYKRKGLQPIDPSNLTIGALTPWMRAVTSSVAALEALEHLPLDVLRGYQEKAAKLTQLLVTAEQSQTFTEENRTALAQFFEEVAALFQPTTYGHFCHMYPHFNFTIDLLTRIEAENRKNANLSAIPLDQIRKAILTENNRINLPSQGTEKMPLIITPIQKILAEAVHLGIVNENDPRYVAVQADLAKSKAR